MSTNYYVEDTKELIGKRDGIGNGKTMFIWIMPPLNFINATRGHRRGPFDWIVNEYGEKECLSLFLDIIEECDEQDYSKIGTSFS
jgi:hypothetical protein